MTEGNSLFLAERKQISEEAFFANTLIPSKSNLCQAMVGEQLPQINADTTAVVHARILTMWLLRKDVMTKSIKTFTH